MTYKEFYIWLDGYLSAKSKEENDGNVYYMDIFPIIVKMKQVKEEKETLISDFIKRARTTQVLPIFPKKDEDDLGHPPKIVM